MQVHNLQSPKGSRKRRKIVGRGNGSGWGKTSGRGENGQNARSGRGILRMLEGGQMPLVRRIPKLGFRSHRPVFYQPIKLEELSRFKANAVVDPQTLKENGVINSVYKPYKILGAGEIKNALTVKAYAFSKTAEEKIKKAGGKIEVLTRKQIREEARKKDQPAAKK